MSRSSDFQVGDKIYLGGVCRGGILDDTVTYPDERLQFWRVKALSAKAVILEPLLPSGELDAFNAAGGEFRIVREP